MNEMELTQSISTLLNGKVWYLMVQFIAIGTIILTLKNTIEALVATIQIRLDKHLSIGDELRVYGKEGYIKGIGLFTLTVATQYGFIRIPTKMWKNTQYELKRTTLGFKRRASDHKENENA